MQEEEYTDYSCSTAIERLGRDVETVLRTWHVDRGSDHHITIAESSSASVSGFSRKSSKVSLTAATAGGDTDLADIRILRSNTLAWNMTVSTKQHGRCNLTFDLELALWDAPGVTPSLARRSSMHESGRPTLARTNSGTSLVAFSDDEDEDDDEFGSKQHTLVRSLRRTPFGEMPAHDFLFDNFSTLFGIGQHISLTPIVPHPLPHELLDSLGQSVLQRHDADSTARWVLASTLSGWLQTALNIATANCQTCIPTFGVWGQYRPNELLQNIEDPTPSLPFGSNGSVTGGSHDKSSSKKNGTRHNRRAAGAPSSKCSLGGDDAASAASFGAGSGDMLVGRTIRTERQKQLDRQQSSANYIDKDAYKRKGGVQLFPQWAQAIRKVEVPPDVLLRKNRGVTFANQRFSPPFFVGNVLTPKHTFDDNDDAPKYMLAAKRQHHNGCNVARRASSMNPSITTTYHIGANLWVSAYSTKSQSVSAADALASSARLSVWAGVLLQHCPDDSMVVLTGARHVFGWFKEKNNSPKSLSLIRRALDARSRKAADTAWRLGGEDDEYQHGLAAVLDLGDDEFEFYKRQCHNYVHEVLEEAWGCTDRKIPLWGPVDDPVAAVYATTTWNGKTTPSSSGKDNDPVVEPLLTFPLRIRSRRQLSKKDWAEMEESVEKAILDPTAPSRFCVQAYYDRDTSVSTLAANQRCILAAMIRAATLPNETLLHHLTDVDLVGLWDDASGRQVARKIADRAGVGNGTKQIVDAMDWSTAVEELISVREAEYVVYAVMNGELTAGFPSSPEDCFNEHDILSPFRKSAPVGRLLSVLFAHMARLRSLSSIALVWRVFCQELRRRWNEKESLPNMQYVAGLDPHPLDLYEKRSFSTIGLKANFAAFLNCTEPDPDDFNCLIGQKLQVFNLGVECVVARELLENEVLEQFIGAGQVPSSLHIADEPGNRRDAPSVASTTATATAPESIVIESSTKATRNKWPKSNVNKNKELDDSQSNNVNYGPPTIDRDLDFWVMDDQGHSLAMDGGNIAADIADDTGFDYVAPAENVDDGDDDSLERALRKKAKKHKGDKRNSFVVEGLPDQQWQGVVMDGDGSEGSIVSSGTLSQAYFDAAEAGSIFSSKHGFVSLDTVVNVADMKRRPGARCPVANASLTVTGDQLYAPYLQRPYPVTDDVALERRIMLAKSCEGEERRNALQTRLEISQRLQRPKLRSDMCSFKAANPHCTIDDFTKWYGNPGSPLDDYSSDPLLDHEFSLEGALHDSAAKKLDRASEAMRVLVATRDFWGKTWEEATPIPASEQEPLFDCSTTVEVVLDYLEQLHPANLMNQVMGVNLSSAYFALASSAKGTMKIGIVQLSVKRLRQKTERALELLSRDATGMLSQIAEGGASTAASTNSSMYATEDTISACEDACNALSVTETMVARATSLLHKFPGQYKLISDLLRFVDGSTLALIDRMGRSSFLSLIHEQQQRQNGERETSKDNLPNPLLREYVFRNLDDDNPAQLAVRFGEEGANMEAGSAREGGVLLALMKSNEERDD